MFSAFRTEFSMKMKFHSCLKLYANTPITLWNKYALISSGEALNAKSVSFDLVVVRQLHKDLTT